MDSQNEQGNQKWYNKILDKVKSYQKQVGELETSVYDVRKKYEEVVARNVFLEAQIKERTNELDRAQKSLLSLQHIWETMRSAEPLGSVLSIVCDSLITTFDYEFCCIMQIHKTPQNTFLRPRAFTENNYLSRLDESLGEPLNSFSIPITCVKNPLVQSLLEKKISTTNTFQKLLDGATPEIDPQRIIDLDIILADRAVVMVPISVEGEKFGVLYGISSRSEILKAEEDYIEVFAGQVELGVTITRLFEQVREQAITDGLTKISNRRHFDQCLAQEAERSLRLNQPFTLITLDMDHLKLINDTHGHSAGDAAIVHLANVLRQNARAIDLPARFGGEEFAILLPGVDINGGKIAAERIRSAIEDTEVEGVGTVTASIGVATFLRHTDNIGELLELADEAMYEAKQLGRNRVVEAKASLVEVDWQELALDTFINVLTQRHSPITPELARDLVKRLKTETKSEDSFINLLYNIVDILIATADTSRQEGQAKDIVKYSVALAEKCELSQIDVDKIRLAALLHDLGKMTMPQEIISKPGPLNDEEWNMVLKHPVIAAQEMLSPLHSLDHILPLIEHHHERWDGSGYPSRLEGEDIPLGSRIISIADSYCAMISDKTYRKALTKQEAIANLKKGANMIWDGQLVDNFVSILLDDNDCI
ncbi:MAG: diguanylate cyclase [Cyanobacteriota bacterium]